jgi:hypothetical protein
MSIKMLVALAFVPVNEVGVCFDEISHQAPNKLLDILDSFERTYMGANRGGRQIPPTFDRGIWNVRDRVIQGLPRTNNSVEGWHQGFQSSLSCQHPTVYKLIKAFLMEQNISEQRIARYLAGRREVGRSKYARITAQLEAIRPTYGNIPRLDYLRGVSHSLSLAV